MLNKILIVCLGNICRSPLAEILFKHAGKPLPASAAVTSAGLAAMVGSPADLLVQKLLHAKGFDASKHRACQLTNQMLFDAELVLVMEQWQRKEIECKLPSVCGKVHLLGKWGGFEIPDPYNKPIEAFQAAYELIQQGVDEWKSRLWNESFE